MATDGHVSAILSKLRQKVSSHSSRDDGSSRTTFDPFGELVTEEFKSSTDGDYSWGVRITHSWDSHALEALAAKALVDGTAEGRYDCTCVEVADVDREYAGDYTVYRRIKSKGKMTFRISIESGEPSLAYGYAREKIVEDYKPKPKEMGSGVYWFDERYG
jgi:hypothetical protein